MDFAKYFYSCGVVCSIFFILIYCSRNVISLKSDCLSMVIASLISIILIFIPTLDNELKLGLKGNDLIQIIALFSFGYGSLVKNAPGARIATLNGLIISMYFWIQSVSTYFVI